MPPPGQEPFRLGCWEYTTANLEDLAHAWVGRLQLNPDTMEISIPVLDIEHASRLWMTKGMNLNPRNANTYGPSTARFPVDSVSAGIVNTLKVIKEQHRYNDLRQFTPGRLETKLAMAFLVFR
jgi:hypothetical protein